MKVTTNKDKTVFNIIHNNGVQTSIKVSPSGHYDTENLERDKPICTNKNKYTVIVSSSKGCQLSCVFCHLTQNNKQYETLTTQDIYNCVVEAVKYVNTQVLLVNKYIKLCYMGEGEAVLQLNKTSDSAKQIIQYALDNKLAAGVDGVDISTTMPKQIKNLVATLTELESWFVEHNIKLNPYNHNETGRSIVRLFYSMHHYNKDQRDSLIPRTIELEKAIGILEKINKENINVVVHYMFMKGVNDSIQDVINITRFINDNQLFKDCEFRILRLNSTNDIIESDKMKNIIEYLKDNLQVKKFKIQFSAGEDVKAACGMFI